MQTVAQQVEQAIDFLVEQGRLEAGSLIVLGCSTSEVGGGHIGKSGSPALGQTLAQAALDACARHGMHLAVQCCEHLNRSLVLPRQVAHERGYEPVFAIPHPHAGGSCAAAAYRLLSDPVLVEAIVAEAGLDIGDTLIGMHLRPVAVPLRPPMQAIGQAHLTMAFSRPKYIGGPRAQYTLDI